MNPRRSIQKYKLTLFDRYGPDAGNVLKAIGFGLHAFGLTVPLFAVLAWKLVDDGTLRLGWAIVFAAVGCIGTAFVVMFAGLASGGLAGSAWKHLMVSGASTPYQKQYSIQDAMVMQGRIADAIASFEVIIAETPDEGDAYVRAAELYAREGNPRRAVELLRAVQSMPTISPTQDVYVSYRIVDLHDGPLGDRGRAIVELARLIDRYPGTAIAASAREGLGKLKEMHIKVE